jgi:hypothetical protein
MHAHACARRHMSWKAKVGGWADEGMRSFQELINIPRLMHPDVYDQQEKQAADMYKFHGKVCVCVCVWERERERVRGDHL